jgi:hypothetical protein
VRPFVLPDLEIFCDLEILRIKRRLGHRYAVHKRVVEVRGCLSPLSAGSRGCRKAGSASARYGVS